MLASSWSLQHLYVDPLARLALLTPLDSMKDEKLDCTVILRSLLLPTINLHMRYFVSQKSILLSEGSSFVLFAFDTWMYIVMYTTLCLDILLHVLN